MADVYSSSALLEARAKIKEEKLKKFQSRPEMTTVINLFKKDREFSIPELGAIRKATTQATKATYLKKKAFTVNEAKTCSPTGETSGSGITTLSWINRNIAITHNYKQFAGNDYAAANALVNDLYNAEVALWTAVDQYLLDYLETNKSGVNLATTAANFDSVNDIAAITSANANRFYNLVTAHMLKNNYTPTYHHVHDTLWTAEQQYYVNQGAGNSANTLFQFAGFEFNPTNLITPGTIGSTDYSSVGYIVPEGAVAILDWNDPLNREGKSTGDKQWMTMQSMLHPEFTFDVLKTTACADTSADGGGTQDLVETWEIGLNLAVAKQPVATANETPIYKYGVTSSFSS